MVLEMADGRLVELEPKGDNALDFGQVVGTPSRGWRRMYLQCNDLDSGWLVVIVLSAPTTGDHQ